MRIKLRALIAASPAASLAFAAFVLALALSSATAARAGSCPNSALRAGASASLPDCRAYEQVSPQAKGGLNAYEKSFIAQVASSGTGIAYLGTTAFPGAAGNATLEDAHASMRTATGWTDQELTPGVPEAHVLKIDLVSYLFSPDLTQEVVQIPLVPLAPGATPGAYNLFLRNPSGEYSLVNAAKPTQSPEELCPESLGPVCFFFADVSQFAGATSDFKHILFESNGQLTSGAPESFIESLYESVEGHVSLVGMLPDGTPAATSTAGAGSSIEFSSSENEKDFRLEHAISADGSHVIFQAPADGGLPDEAQAGLIEVYDRINGVETKEISAPAPGATPANTAPAAATFAGASADGSRVFFTSAAELTTASKTGSEGGEDLYEYSLATKTLADLTVDTAPADSASGASVLGTVDESVDGSYVYFVAKGQLDPGHGIDGQPNVYVIHDRGRPVFVATLNNGTCKFISAESGDQCVWTPYPGAREAYVTPDGHHLAFMSDRSIPTANFPAGYNNNDVATGVPDTEVYEYSVPTQAEEEAGGDGTLLCGSCDPTGTQPIGGALIGGITVQLYGSVEERTSLAGISSPFYRARALSDNGARLFYTASVPTFVHGHLGQLIEPFEKVREYEADGEGSCTTPGGCQYLISSAANGESDSFLGASADGSDVYIATPTPLTASDTDEVVDIYDARVGGGFHEQPAQPPCTSGCRAEAPAATPPTPLLGNNTGPSGNLAPTVKAVVKPPARKCAKGRVRRHRKCVKVKKKAAKKSAKKAGSTTHAHADRKAR
jgi:hypothetical protein